MANRPFDTQAFVYLRTLAGALRQDPPLSRPTLSNAVTTVIGLNTGNQFMLQTDLMMLTGVKQGDVMS